MAKKVKEPKLKIIPLGGLGEIGKNLTVLEYQNDIIVIDLGSIFPREDMPGVDLVIPDTSYLEHNRDKIRTTSARCPMCSGTCLRRCTAPS